MLRFIIIGYATEIIFLPIFSYIILNRQMTLFYIPAFLLAVGGVLIHELLIVSRKSPKSSLEIDFNSGY